MVDRGEPARATGSGELRDDGCRCLIEAFAAVDQAGGDLVGGGEADEELAVPGRRDGAACVVGKRAGADDRAVPDAAGLLAGHPAGRGRGGEVAAAVAGDGADRPMPAGLVVEPLAAEKLVERAAAR